MYYIEDFVRESLGDAGLAEPSGTFTSLPFSPRSRPPARAAKRDPPRLALFTCTNMAPFSKPETVLKQAEGLVAVGQTHAALSSLTEMFASKRFRSTPLASLEPIMLRFIELAVELRKGRSAKEGLMQYKNIAQNSSVASIEVVVKRFIQLADNKVVEAQEKANRAVALVDIDDLEASETPESILLGAVSGDQNRDRTDRALVTPWLKFLWESYRTALETLKNNARLEQIYQVRQELRISCLSLTRRCSKSRSRHSNFVSNTFGRSSSVACARLFACTFPMSPSMRTRRTPSTSPTQTPSSVTSTLASPSSMLRQSSSCGKRPSARLRTFTIFLHSRRRRRVRP